MNEDKPTLSVGKYTIELTNGPSQVYSIDEEGHKHWVCATTDPDKAMAIVEGLLLVEMKRFYNPDSKPKVTTGNKPFFLRKS